MNYKNLFKTTLALLCSLLIFSACERDNNKKTETAGEVALVGNCRKSDMSALIYSWKDGGTVTFSATSSIKASKLQQGGTKIIGIRAYLPNSCTDFSVFAGTDYEAPTVTKGATWQPYGWQYVLFDEPIEVGAEDLYIGYTVTSTGFAAENSSSSKDLIYSNGQWDELGALLSVQAIMTGGDYSSKTQVDMVIDNAVMERDWIKLGESPKGNVEIRNNGVKTLKNVKLVATMGSSSTEIPIADAIMNGQSRQVSIDGLSASAEGSSDLKIEVVADGDSQSKNNSYSTAIRVYGEKTFTRNRILIEQITATWCTYCPGGAQQIKNSIAELSDPDKVAWIAFHGQDDFATTETNTLLSNFSFSGYPACAINRTEMNVLGETSKFWNPNYATVDLFAPAVDEPAMASLSIARTYDDATRELNLTVSGESTEENLYVTAIVLLNGTVHEQTNGGSNYVHNNVPCTFLTAPTGDKITVGDDGKYSIDLKATVAEKLNSFEANSDNMNVVVYVHGAVKTAPVYNADLISLKEAAPASIIGQLYENNNTEKTTDAPYYVISREYSPVQ